MNKYILTAMVSIFLVSCTQSKAPEVTNELPQVPAPTENTGSVDQNLSLDTLRYKTINGKDILIFEVTPGQKITSPLKISGMVPTSWINEGVLPIKIVSMDGKVVKQATGSGNIWDEKGEVILPNVNFSAQIDFDIPEGIPAGKIVISADNPSGMPENDDSFELPILF